MENSPKQKDYKIGIGGENMSKQRSRYAKGKRIRGINNGRLGFWRKTQVDRKMSKAEYESLGGTGTVIAEEEE